MAWYWQVGAFALTIWMLDLCFKVIRFAVLYVAMRVFGWHPKIYNEALAKGMAEKCMNELYRERAEAGQPLNDNDKGDIESFGAWVIEMYTANYVLKGK